MPLVLTPTDLRFQPIATEDVARFVIWAIEAGPAGLLPNVGGPQVRTLRDLTREWLDVRRDRRRIVHLRLPGRAADAVRAGRLTCPDRAVGDLTWREWLERTYGATHEPSIRETAR